MNADIIFIENGDSFSWNVVDRLPFAREDILILHGRDLDPERLPPARALVIGPGPTDPIRAGLLGIVRHAASLRLPTLGICLGHQALGLLFGASLVRVPPMHGKRSTVIFRESRLFPDVHGPVVAMRYHSLALAEVRPPLRSIAETEAGLSMAVEHESLPMAGLQFHPDSYATPRGEEILRSFFTATLGSLAR